VLSVGRQTALTLPGMREFLEGRPVDMGDGETVTRPSAYYQVVARRQQAWLDALLLGGAPDRDRLEASMADDPELARELLAWVESALLTAATKWGLSLDFSEASLEGVEQVLGQLHEALVASGRPGQTPLPEQTVRRAVMLWGAYVGEVLRRSLNGRWTNSFVDGHGKVLRVEIGSVQTFPLRKVEKRIRQGPGDAIPFYFHGTRQIVEGKLGT
jgi:hypothetical protein